MDLVPPPEKITLPAGVNLVQCFVCTAMFYAQEDHDKHIKLHRKADILRAITEHRLHQLHPHRGGLLRPPDVGFKLEPGGGAAGTAHHDLTSHSHHLHQPHQPHHLTQPAHSHHQAHSHHSHHAHHADAAHVVHPGWMEAPAAHERPPAPLPQPPLAHLPAHQIMLSELHSLHSWPLIPGASHPGHQDVIYTDVEPGPSGSSDSAAAAAPAAPSEAEVPAPELLCTEESLHSSCPSPGEPAAMRAAPEYAPQDFSIYGSEQAVSEPPPAYSSSPSLRGHISPAPDQPEPDFTSQTVNGMPLQDFVSFKCIHCSREFSSAEEIHLHLSEVSEASHVCQVCHEVCLTDWQLEEHMDQHNTPRPFKCGVCAREFRSSSLHRQHILQHIPDRIRDRVESELPGSPVPAAESASPVVLSSSCHWAQEDHDIEAEKQTSSSTSMETAEAVSPVIPPKSEPRPAPKTAAVKAAKLETKRSVSCGTCGAQFNFVSALQRHILVEHKKQRRRPTRRICSCKHCGRIFYSYKQLRWHAEIHGKKPHTCPTCGLRFLHGSWMTRHMRAHHDPSYLGPHSGDSKPCPICNRVYMRSSLQKHIRMMHQDLKPYQCSRCGKRFSAKCNLKSHELSHLSYRDRPHKCTQCRKAYTTARDLRVHLATHEGKKYPCKFCGREFTRVSSMNLHLREHTGEKRHVCGMCGKRFARKAYLTGHVRIHTGERPHECAVCGRSFASRSNYNAHVKSHTRREPVNAEL